MLLGVARCDGSTDRAIQTTALLSTTTVDGRIRGLPGGGVAKTVKARVFSRLAGKRLLGWPGAMTRHVIQFSSLSTYLLMAGLEAYYYRVKFARGYTDKIVLV